MIYTIKTPQFKDGKTDYYHEQSGVIIYENNKFVFIPETYEDGNHKVLFSSMEEVEKFTINKK